MSKGKKRALTIAGILLLILVTVAICYFLFRRQQEPDPLYDNNATIGILPGVDIDQRRKELQDLLDRSVIAFSINTKVIINILITCPGRHIEFSEHPGP